MDSHESPNVPFTIMFEHFLKFNVREFQVLSHNYTTIVSLICH